MISEKWSRSTESAGFVVSWISDAASWRERLVPIERVRFEAEKSNVRKCLGARLNVKDKDAARGTRSYCAMQSDAPRARVRSAARLVRDEMHIVAPALKRLGVSMDLCSEEFSSAQIIHLAPDGSDMILGFPDFLSPDQCDQIICAALKARDELNDDAECTLYLNYRVNRELEQSGAQRVSQEAAQLIADPTIYASSKSEMSSALDLTSSGAVAVAADMPSGFRTQLPPTVLTEETGLMDKIMRLLLGEHGAARRKPVFEEGLWIRPDPRTVVIRDQTTVHYKLGEGVAPHVDGKDATLLVYLNDMLPAQSSAEADAAAGGRTVFPQVGVAVPPRRGMALLYESRGNSLLHFAEEVRLGEKWVMQLLIDHRIKHNGPYVDRNSGEIFYD